MDELDEIIKQINDEFGEGTITTADKIDPPENPYKDFMDRNPMAGGGMLVQPSADGRRPGYAKDDVTYKGKYEADRYNTVKDIDSLKLKKEKINLKASDFRTGDMRYPDDKGQKYVQQYLDSVQKGYLNNDMSNVTRFKTFIKNKYPKTFAKVIADVNHSGYRGMMDIGVDYKRKLANEIITASNNQLKYINQFDIIKKLLPQKRAVTVKNQGINTIGNLLDKDTLNAFRKLDTMEDKLSKSLTYIVNNNVEILDPNKIKIKGSAAAGYQTQSPIKKMMNYLAGGGSRKQLNKALEQNKWYQSQNYKVGKTTRNTFDDLSQAYSKDFIGQNFNDAYDYALNRRGSVSVKGMTKAITPERLIWNFAARSADRHFKDLEDPKDWLVKIVDNKGNPIDYSNLPVDDKGRRIIDTNKYQFVYEGQTFNKNNLSTKGYQSGLFNDVYKAANTITSYLNTDVPDPDNPKKTISLRELFEKTDGRIFASIGHDDARGGVKKKPFNTFKILTNLENQALFNAYDKIKSPQLRKDVVNFIYGETKGLKGDRYKQAWINKNVPLITEYIKTGQGLEQTPYKQAVNMPPKDLQKALASFSNNPKCIITFGKTKAAADGGRIGYQTGTVSLSDCAKDGAKNFNDGKFKTADQVQDAAKLLSGGRRVLSGLMKYGIIPELAFVGLEATGRSILGEKPLNAIKKSIDTFTFGLTDFTSGIEAEKFGKFGDLKLDVDKYRNSLAKVNSIQQDIANLETLNTGSQFGYEGDQTEAIQMKKAQLEAAKKELQQNMISPDKVSFIDRMSDNIADAQMAKSGFAKASFKDQMEGIPGVADYMDTETARVFPRQPSQAELNLNLLPNFREALKTKEAKMDRVILNAPDEVLKDISPEALEFKKGLQEAYKMENLKDVFGAEQIYGTQGSFFGEPLAKGGRAGFKFGTRKSVLSLIEEGVKKTPKDTTSALDKLIKQTLDEDLFDKKDRIIDQINISETKKRKNYPYNQQVFEEPKNLDFYDAITKSNFKTKTGPYYDRIRRLNKAGGGILKQAGDRSGAMLESMNPDSQGLQGILNRVKKTQE